MFVVYAGYIIWYVFFKNHESLIDDRGDLIIIAVLSIIWSLVLFYVINKAYKVYKELSDLFDQYDEKNNRS
ncbi:hypothetical protein KSD_73440 [Ktedonobacter sp. SOSP1-85]|nr:hypothetical protein KSD_73440 [Ktedonobacter sp. SOSP1-85]